MMLSVWLEGAMPRPRSVFFFVHPSKIRVVHDFVWSEPLEIHLNHHTQSTVNVTLGTVPLHQRGAGNDDKLNGRLPHLFHKRQRAMHGIALGTSVKHGVECHRVQADAPLLHFLMRAEDLLGTLGHGEAFEIGGVSGGVDAGPRHLRVRMAVDQLQSLVWLPI